MCFKCYRKGHFQKHCLSKAVASITEATEQLELHQTEEEPDFYLDTNYLETAGGNTWKVEVKVNSSNVPFRVDTGAEVTAMSESAWRSLHNVQQLHATKCVLDSKPLSVTGVASVTLSFKQSKCDKKVYVIKDLKNNLLGLSAIKGLNILQQVDAIETPIPEQYPKLFTGLGTFSQEYTIKLKEGAIPRAIYTTRRVPLALREQVKREVMSMERMGVISPIT